MVKKKNETVVRYCRDCALSKPDMKFENLSLDGKPTLLSCPHQEWRMVITTTEVCSHYTEKKPVMEDNFVTENKLMDDWMNW